MWPWACHFSFLVNYSQHGMDAVGTPSWELQQENKKFLQDYDISFNILSEMTTLSCFLSIFDVRLFSSNSVMFVKQNRNSKFNADITKNAVVVTQ